MIVVTGAAGFIGSCVAKYLNENLNLSTVLVDDFNRPDKTTNVEALSFCEKVDRKSFFDWVEGKDVDAIVHLGARTDTTEFDYSIFQELNVDYSKRVWHFASAKKIPLIYASSAATYGDGAFGYRDDHNVVAKLVPLNPYGRSKNEFDNWVLSQRAEMPWYGLKFFNVYGPNEYHKGRMASVIYHAYNQIEKTGSMKLFKSHNPNFGDGGQLRDFIYVKDICSVILHLLSTLPAFGLYNLGTGKARTFLDLAKSVFEAMGKDPCIDFIDTPADIRDKYQYFTEADMSKLVSSGYNKPFTELEDGIKDYVKKYLAQGRKAFKETA